MSEPTTAEMPLLHALRLLGAAEVDQLAVRAELSKEDVARGLDRASDADLVRTRGPDGSSWVLTEAGRAELEAWLAAEVDRLHARVDLESLYDDFLVLNPRVLELCSEWQLREVDGELVLNDHRDSVHDRWVRTRLQATHREARPVLQGLAAAAPWFAGYTGRLDSALEQVLGGQLHWFDSPAVDSYHSVWFELHEDLLATLGIERHVEAIDARPTDGGGA